MSQSPWFKSPVMPFLAGPWAQSHETTAIVFAKLHYRLELGVLFQTHMLLAEFRFLWLYD